MLPKQYYDYKNIKKLRARYVLFAFRYYQVITVLFLFISSLTLMNLKLELLLPLPVILIAYINFKTSKRKISTRTQAQLVKDLEKSHPKLVKFFLRNYAGVNLTVNRLDSFFRIEGRRLRHQQI